MFYSYKEVKENMLIPVNLNWLGFDCYVADPGCPDKVVVDYFKIISRLRKPTQKIIIALDGYWGGPKAPTFADEQKVIERIRLWQKMIVSSNQIVGGPGYAECAGMASDILRWVKGRGHM